MSLTRFAIGMGATLALAGCLAPNASGPAAPVEEQPPRRVSAPETASGGGRLGASNVVYVGSFRLPTALAGSAHGFAFAGFGSGTGGGALAYNPVGNGGAGSLFISGSGVDYRGASVAEVAIPGTGGEPALVQGDHVNGTAPTADNPLGLGGSTNVASLPTTRFLQNFTDISGGLVSADPAGNDVVVSNLLVYHNQLYAAVRHYFDGGALARVSHLRHGLTLSVHDTFGYETVRDPKLWNGWADVAASPGRAVGMIAGPMGDVPPALQASLGGPVISGVWGLSILARTSVGPAAFSWNPDQLGSDTPSKTLTTASSSPVNATGLLYYPTEHKTLGDWGWRFTNQAHYDWNDFPAGIIIEDNSLLFPMITSKGHAINPNTGQDVSTHYYGDATYDWALNGRHDPKSGPVGSSSEWFSAYNPQSSGSGHGPNGWPYYYRFVAYDVADLQAVKAGTKKPWEIVPSGKWDLQVPFTMGGRPYPPATPNVTYDRAHRIMYLIQNGSVDQPGNYFPLVHVYRLTPAS